jgi:nicotinate-nucleotide adenylyltransferase
MNLCLFGGTFDPVHRGHLQVARAAAKRFKLQRVEFVVSDIPPHKQRRAITAYLHRYAMVALALRGQKILFPSSLEAPLGNDAGSSVHYTIETVRRVKQGLKSADRLFFLIGMDAFTDIATWREAGALLRECEFIVASRPGYSLADIGRALPASLRPAEAVLERLSKNKMGGKLVHGGATIHLLQGVNSPVSASEVRKVAGRGRVLARLVPPDVAEYIKKMELYRGESSATRLQSNQQSA